MAKMKLFGLLFSFFNLLLISWTPILASNEMEPARLEQCNLPAPDSFRITQVGGDFIKLAWNPIFPGALHQLIIMESDGNGGYVTILVENNVSGGIYNAGNLLPGTGYKFILATKCASGDPSEIKTYIDGITLIVDLLVSGRKPINPVTTGDCKYIPLNFLWKGFKVVGQIGEENIENFFEISIPSSNNLNLDFFNIEIKRHYIDNPIVAANKLKIYPDCNFPELENVGTRFFILRLINNGPLSIPIGYVNLIQHFNPPALEICPDLADPIFPWDPSFDLVPLVSSKSGLAENCDGNFSQPRIRIASEQNLINATNPFNSFIKLTLEGDNQNSGGLLQIYNNFGELVLKEQLASFQNELILNTTNILPGIYFLVIQGDKLFAERTLVKF